MNLSSLVLLLGVSHANPQDPGIWYVADQPHVLHQNAFTYGLGRETEKYRVGIQSLGKQETDAIVGQAYFTTIGKQWGIYAQRKWSIAGPVKLSGGLWIYRGEVDSTISQHYFSSVSWGYAPLVGVESTWHHVCYALTVRGAENRSVDWNGHHQPSPIKGFVSTFEVRF